MEFKGVENQLDSEFITQFLSRIIIEEYVLFLKTKNAFWNYELNETMQDVKLFESQSKEIDDLINQIANRIIILNDCIELPYRDLPATTKNYNKNQAIQELLTQNKLLITTIKEWNRLLPISGNDEVKNLIQKLLSKHHWMAEDLKVEMKKK